MFVCLFIVCVFLCFHCADVLCISAEIIRNLLLLLFLMIRYYNYDYCSVAYSVSVLMCFCIHSTAAATVYIHSSIQSS